MKQKDLTPLVRPLRQTIERTLTWEGAYTRPEPVQVGPFTLTASVTTNRGVRTPYTIWYRAQLNGQTVVEVSRQPEFIRIMSRKLAEMGVAK